MSNMLSLGFYAKLLFEQKAVPGASFFWRQELNVPIRTCLPPIKPKLANAIEIGLLCRRRKPLLLLLPALVLWLNESERYLTSVLIRLTKAPVLGSTSPAPATPMPLRRMPGSARVRPVFLPPAQRAMLSSACVMLMLTLLTSASLTCIRMCAVTHLCSPPLLLPTKRHSSRPPTWARLL